MTSTIWAARQRAKDYWELDGLPKIVSGLSGMAVGILFLFLQHKSPSLQLIAVIAIVAISLFGVRGGDKEIVEWLKARITYPRSGYVDSLGETRPWGAGSTPAIAPSEPRTTSWKRRIAVFGFMMLCAAYLFAWGNVFLIGTPWICLIAGVLTAGMSIVMHWRHRKNLLWLSAVGWVLIGLVLGTWSFARHVPIPFVLISCGALSLLSGTISLLQYLRHHPLPQG